MNLSASLSSAPLGLEDLEPRALFSAAPWAYWPAYLGFDKIVREYPWLNGGGNNVVVIDKGIDYWQTNLGGDPSHAVASPRVVNVTLMAGGKLVGPTPEGQLVDPGVAHGTGVAGILAALPYDYNGFHNQGILQNSLLYNLPIGRSQVSIRYALQWVLDNHAKYHITAINLTDFIGTTAAPLYAPQIKALWDAGVFVATPVANSWNDPANPHPPIEYPAKDPYIYGVGGILQDGSFSPVSQRGRGLDVLGPSSHVTVLTYSPGSDLKGGVRATGTGNSWATPYVVGTAVLMQQIDPTLTPAQIMQIIQSSGVRVPDPDATGKYVRLDMYNAIKMTYRLRDDAIANHSIRRSFALPRTRRGGLGVSGMKLLVGAPDWYTFTVGAKSNWRMGVGYSNLGQHIGASIYDEKGELIGTIGRRAVDLSLGTGRYYIQVNNTQTLLGTYSLSVAQSA